MNSCVHITTLQGQLGKRAVEMQAIASRIKGCSGLIDALADCDNMDMGLESADAFAAKIIARRLNEYADIWCAGAKHITTPWLPIDHTDMHDETLAHAMAWLHSDATQPAEPGDLFETYAEYLEPCHQAFRTIENHYTDSRVGTDEARTFNVAFFIVNELEQLIADIRPLMQEVYDAWCDLPKPGSQEGVCSHK